MEAIGDYIVSWANSRAAVLVLFVLAWCESFFLWVWPDLLLIAMSVINPSLGLFYALVCSAGSLAGGSTGYVVGLRGGRAFLHRRVGSKRSFSTVEGYFRKYDIWAVAIAGFTPIPYNVFAIASGVFKMGYLRFLAVSAVSRTTRFVLIGGLIMLFGPSMAPLIKKYASIVSVLVVILVCIAVFVGHRLSCAIRSRV